MVHHGMVHRTVIHRGMIVHAGCRVCRLSGCQLRGVGRVILCLGNSRGGLLRRLRHRCGRCMGGMVVVLRGQRACQGQQRQGEEAGGPHAKGLTVTTCIMPACMW